MSSRECTPGRFTRKLPTGRTCIRFYLERAPFVVLSMHEVCMCTPSFVNVVHIDHRIHSYLDDKFPFGDDPVFKS